MKFTGSFAALFLLVEAALGFPGVVLERSSDLAKSYDYVIVGGGTSGLVVANRLTENPKVSVLVIESGPLVSKEEEFENLLIPAMNIPKQNVLPYWWPINVVPDTELNNRPGVPRAPKIVGGSSAVNAMIFDVGSKRDYNDWKEYTGWEEWGWNGIEPYLRKCETFTPPTKKIEREYGVTWIGSAHGKNGPISSTFPPLFYPHYKNWVAGERELGISQVKDHHTGQKVGGHYIPYTIKPKEWIRSYARNGYYEPVKRRKNLHLLPENHVTAIKFDKKNRAVGVEFAPSPDVPARLAKAKREVILAAGALHTPRLLMVSGLGDKNLLKKHSIKTISHLPGVGNNLQDNPNVVTNFAVNWELDPTAFVTNATFQAEQLAQYKKDRTGYMTVPAEVHISYLSLKLLSPKYWKKLLSSAENVHNAAKYLRKGLDKSVVKGYLKQRQITLKSFVSKDATPAAEMVRLRAVVSRPLSRGYVEISSKNPWDAVTLNWRTLSDPYDGQILVEGIKYLRSLLKTRAIRKLNPVEVAPGTSITSDSALLAWIKSVATPTYFHLISTAALGPKELGGVVDRKLQVYGVKGLRIVDASVIPFNFAAHTVHTVYAVAEKAADIIKRDCK